jgi:glycosyltransferase involved in cell wall biosynthesis
MITVVINSYQSEKHIADCVVAAKLLTDDVLVVDMESTDRTAELARQFGARVVTHAPCRYVEPARMYGIRMAGTPWVCIIDTDERMTPELAKQIRETIKIDPPHTHFAIRRKNIFASQVWLKHGGWWPDYQTRLIRKDALRDWPARIHATPVIDGSRGMLSEAILHYFHSDISSMVRKTIIFEDIESELLYNAKRPVTTVTFLRKYVGELTRRLLFAQGFRDGVFGWLEAIYQAYSKTITWLYLYEKTNITKPIRP